MTLARAGNQKNSPNELLAAHGERLDGGATSRAGASDQALEAVGARHGPLTVKASRDRSGMPSAVVSGNGGGRWRRRSKPAAMPSARSYASCGDNVVLVEVSIAIDTGILPRLHNNVLSG